MTTRGDARTSVATLETASLSGPQRRITRSWAAAAQNRLNGRGAGAAWTSTGIARGTHVRRVTAVETASRRSGISDSGEATSTEKLTPPPAKSRLWSTS